MSWWLSQVLENFYKVIEIYLNRVRIIQGYDVIGVGGICRKICMKVELG